MCLRHIFPCWCCLCCVFSGCVSWLFFFFKLQLLGKYIHSDKQLYLIAHTKISLALTMKRNGLSQDNASWWVTREVHLTADSDRWLPMYYEVLCTNVYWFLFFCVLLLGWYVLGRSQSSGLLTSMFLLVSWEPVSWLLNGQLLAGKHCSMPDKPYWVLVPAGSCFSLCVRESVPFHKPELFG